ncbi:MAG: hypothetical protein JHD07_21960 [Bradyrhizobium sp.]|uniref:hypothetical protein n=1 Tax=Bradyrhizobium sp. TaxID=376 RepID=UPI001A349366|nr:hypothetical protein [Bradyrhizobium sp.]MBJ7405827.1 hypothetical protein [Bradyrhizobium sp.]
MANEAFALSPMSARAAEPNEQDYDAIREAFMETARGRWFLGEYAKRNRNADTRMVLDAVARIEETLAAQRQPVVEDRLPEALVEISRAIREAEAIALAAFDPAAIEASLAPIPRGVRIIKEISWRWREIGADGRICDLIDSQLASIEAACGQAQAIDPRVELRIAFDLLKDRVDQTDGGGAPQAAPASPVQEAASPFAPVEHAPAAMASEAPVAFTEVREEISEAPERDAAVEASTVAETDAMAERAMDAAAAQEIAAESHIPAESAPLETVAPDDAGLETVAFEEPATQPEALPEVSEQLSLDAAAEAEDEAILDAIALEMAAPDPEFDEIIVQAEMEAAVPEPMVTEAPASVAAELPEPIAPQPVVVPVMEEPADAPIAMDSLARLTDAIAEAAAEVMEQQAPAMAAAASSAAPTATLPMPSPLPASMSDASLGATILASGILQKPRAPANDPLAPIRRMTQAEKIAFFS